MAHRPSRSIPVVLLVEDNEADARLTREALFQSEREKELHVVRDGLEALNFLRREGDYAEAPRPDLVLLDLNLPKKHGHEVLAEIREDSELAAIPVVILTTSDIPADIRRSYQLHASSYIQKPVEIDDFFQVMELLETYWFSAVQLPA